MRARIIVLTIVLSGMSLSVATAFVVVVTDPLTTAKNAAIAVLKEQIMDVLTDQATSLRRMAKRLSLLTDLKKYAVPDAPRWRTRRIDDPLAATEAYMSALNAGDHRGLGYEAVTNTRVTPGTELSGLVDTAPAGHSAIRSALATLDLADATIIAGTNQTGQIRGSRRVELNAIAALEADVVEPVVDAERHRRHREARCRRTDPGTSAGDPCATHDGGCGTVARRQQAGARHRSGRDEHADSASARTAVRPPRPSGRRRRRPSDLAAALRRVMPAPPRLAIIATVQQAITTLLTTYEPEFLRFGNSLFLAFATILIAWHGIRMMLSRTRWASRCSDSPSCCCSLPSAMRSSRSTRRRCPGIGDLVLEPDHGSDGEFRQRARRAIAGDDLRPSR